MVIQAIRKYPRNAEFSELVLDLQNYRQIDEKLPIVFSKYKYLPAGRIVVPIGKSLSTVGAVRG